MSILKSLEKLNLLYVGLTVIIFMFMINKVSGTTILPALPSEIQHDFEDAYDMYEMMTTEATENNATAENKTEKPIVGNYWMMKMGEIKEDLLHVQAVVVKDEDTKETSCIEGKLKTRRRYLMCAGSILHRNRVLTTASCLHEAMHIKHNIRAPLAVVIAPMKSSIQIIRVAEYKIHPAHNTNPYSPDHMKHNIAILSLACRISKVNYYKISLPTEPMTHICTEENCVLAIFRKTKHEIVISQIQAPQVPLNDRRRRSINAINESLIINNVSSLINNNNYNDMKKLSKRSADGTSGCAQTGTAVMVNRTQTAIVAISCDDRQENGSWFYTDLFHNNDWISGVLNDWNKSHETKPPSNNGVTESSNDNSTNARGCGNCIFNFYISVGCKEKGNCPKGSRVMTNVPTVNHNVRQVTNSEFIDNWSNAKRDPTKWNKQAVSDDNVLKFSQELADKCPDNSPECSESAEINNHNYNKPIYRNGDLPIVIRTYNQSVINGNDKFYHNNNGFERFGNHSWVLRKVKRIPKENLFALRNSASKKHVKGEMGNWLRRRHVNSSVKNNEKVKNNKRSGF